MDTEPLDQLQVSKEEQTQSTDPQPQLYSIFTRREKRWIVFLIACAGLFSPLSSFIYYPALYSLAQALHVTLQLVDLTITSYMVVSGVVPSLLGDMAETLGRRPLYLGALLVYTAANVGLAVQSSYWALLILRMLQSAGSSGTISFGYAVVSDIATPAERGTFVGAVLLGLGPVLGGILVQYAGWRWIFWTLTIMSSICFCVLAIGLPETARTIVGNGSIRPNRFLNQSYIGYLEAKREDEGRETGTQIHRKFRPPSLKPCFKVIFQKENAMIMLMNGIYYMIYCCVQASLSGLFIKLYGFKEVQAGLVYLPFGIGCAIASYTSGFVMNWQYRSVGRDANFEVDRLRGDNLLFFPIEKARLRATYVYATIMAVSTIGYGWALQKRSHYAIPLVLQFFIGAFITAIFNAYGTLLVDVNPDGPATASAAANLFRCSLAGAGLAVVDVLINAVGSGWSFTIFTAIPLLTVPMAAILQRFGMGWRRKGIEDSTTTSGSQRWS